MPAQQITKDQEIVIFHYRLGVAISQWAFVEAVIGQIVINLFPTDDNSSQAFAVGYFSLEGFRARLILADNVVKRKLSDSEHLKQWKSLVEKANDASKVRNKLAHWIMQQHFDTDTKPGRRVVLSPWVRSKPRNEKERNRPTPGSKRITDLIRDAQDFRKLAHSFQELFGLIFATGIRLTPPPELGINAGTADAIKKEIIEVFRA